MNTYSGFIFPSYHLHCDNQSINQTYRNLFISSKGLFYYMYSPLTISKVFIWLNVILIPIILKIQVKIGKKKYKLLHGSSTLGLIEPLWNKNNITWVLFLIDTIQRIFYYVYQMEQGSHLSSIKSLVSYIDHFSWVLSYFTPPPIYG